MTSDRKYPTPMKEDDLRKYKYVGAANFECFEQNFPGGTWAYTDEDEFYHTITIDYYHLFKAIEFSDQYRAMLESDASSQSYPPSYCFWFEDGKIYRNGKDVSLEEMRNKAWEWVLTSWWKSNRAMSDKYVICAWRNASDTNEYIFHLEQTDTSSIWDKCKEIMLG